MHATNAMESLVNLREGLISREIFSSEAIFREELERIFARAWLFVGHESQIPEPGDYFVSRMGSESVILCRDEKRAGDLGAEALRTRLVAAFGDAWVAQRWRRMITDADPNALHQQGRLAPILRARPWRRAELPDVHVA